jgi:hypothetical protein
VISLACMKATLPLPRIGYAAGEHRNDPIVR